MNKWRTLSLFIVIVSSVFIAGAVDILFPDVIPIRPYTSFFKTILPAAQASSLPGFWTGLHLAPAIIPLIAILILLVIPLHGLSLPPLILGPHGKSDTSHSKWHDKMAKKSVAKRILKRIKETEERARRVEPQANTVTSTSP